MITNKINDTVQKNNYDDKIRNVAGTLAIEGITISEASRNNIDRIMSGQASYQQILSEIKAKYEKRT